MVTEKSWTYLEKKEVEPVEPVLKNIYQSNTWKGRWGVFLEMGDFQVVSSVSFKKSMFSLLLEYFFLFGKSSHLL